MNPKKFIRSKVDALQASSITAGHSSQGFWLEIQDENHLKSRPYMYFSPEQTVELTNYLLESMDISMRVSTESVPVQFETRYTVK